MGNYIKTDSKDLIGVLELRKVGNSAPDILTVFSELFYAIEGGQMDLGEKEPSEEKLKWAKLHEEFYISTWDLFFHFQEKLKELERLDTKADSPTDSLHSNQWELAVSYRDLLPDTAAQFLFVLDKASSYVGTMKTVPGETDNGNGASILSLGSGHHEPDKIYLM